MSQRNAWRFRSLPLFFTSWMFPPVTPLTHCNVYQDRRHCTKRQLDRIPNKMQPADIHERSNAHHRWSFALPLSLRKDDVPNLSKVAHADAPVLTFLVLSSKFTFPFSGVVFPQSYLVTSLELEHLSCFRLCFSLIIPTHRNRLKSSTENTNRAATAIQDHREMMERHQHSLVHTSFTMALLNIEQ